MKRKFSKILSILLVVVMLTSFIQLPAFASTPTFVDASVMGSHRDWMPPYGDELTHFDYSATDGDKEVSYKVNYPANGTATNATIDSNGILSLDRNYAQPGWPTFINIRASSDNFSTYVQSKNIRPLADTPYIHNFDTDPYCLSNGLIHDTQSDTSTVVLENVNIISDSNGNNYAIEADSSKNYIGFRSHHAAINAGIINSTLLQFDVNLSSEEPFSVALNSSAYSIFKWDNATQKLVESPYASRPYSTFTPPEIVAPGWHNVKIMFDFNKTGTLTTDHRKTYQRAAIFFDDELVTTEFIIPELNAYNASNPGRIIRFEGSAGIDNFKYYGSSTPHAYGVGLASAPKSGATVEGRASMYSLGNFTNSETHFRYSYYVSDSVDPLGSYTKITSTDSKSPLYINANGKLVINSDCTDRYVKVGARVWNRGGMSPEIMSKEAYKIEGYADGFTAPYVIYDAARDGTISRSYDGYYDTIRPVVEIAGKKAIPWGPKSAGSLNPNKVPDKSKPTILPSWEKYGDIANRPSNIVVVDSNNNRKIPLNDYQYLVVEMYSKVATNQPFLWRIYDKPNGGNFYSAGFNANWEGEWKQIKFALAGGLNDCGDFTTSSTPQGKPYDSKMISLLANTSSALYTDTEVYVSKIYLEGERQNPVVPNENGEIILPDEYDPNTMTDYVSMLKAKHPNKAHPRLLVTDEIINRIKANKDTDEFMKKAYEAVKAEADTIMDEVSTSAAYIKNGAVAFNRSVEEVAKFCGLMYLLTGDESYAERVWKEAKIMIDMVDAEGYYWYNTSTGLDAGHISNGMALLYDWCYDYLDDTQKLAIRNALMKNAFAYAMRIRGGGGYMGFRNNVIAANSKGFMTAALAICDESGYENFCNEFINNVITYLPINLGHQFVPDGSYAEGAGYWTYSVYSLMFMTDAMLTSIGTDGGLQDMPGLEKTGYFPFAVRGTNNVFNVFNYSDASRNLIQYLSPVYHYLSQKFDIPALRADRIANLEKWTREEYPRPTYSSVELYAIEDLLWYNPDHEYDSEYDDDWSESLPKDYFLDGLEPIMSMRSGYSNSDYYIAAKGGNSKTGHDQYDAGTFVLDALGKRWIHDLGAGVYGSSIPDYYYYVERAEGHNCIVFDPERGWADGSGQTVGKNPYDTKCPIVDSGASDNESFAVLDLQPSYQETVEEYKRGFALVNDRSQFIVQDEFTTKEPFDLYSYFHIEKTTVVVNSDGRSLTLQSYNPRKFCRVDFISDIPDFEVGVMDAVIHPDSPHVDSSVSSEPFTGDRSTSYQKIYFHAENVQNGTITVVFTPIAENKSVALPKTKSLADWDEYLSDDTYATYSDVYINSINGNSVNITTNGSVTGTKKLILASYSGNRLVSVKSVSVTFDRNTKDYTVEGFEPGEHDTIKAFVWDDMTSTLTPLCSAK